MSEITAAISACTAHFLEGEHVELTAIPIDEGDLITLCAPRDEAITAALALVDAQARGAPRANLYICSNPVRERGRRRPGTQGVSRNITTLIDLDPRDLSPEAAAIAEEMARLISDYISRKVEPEHAPHAITTGRGAQLHLFHEDLGEDPEELKPRLLLALSYVFDRAEAHVDTAMHNADRLIRLAGSVNWRTGRAGRRILAEPGAPCALISAAQIRELVEALEDEPAYVAAVDARGLVGEDSDTSRPGAPTTGGFSAQYVAACREASALPAIPALELDGDRRENAIRRIINAVRGALVPPGCGHYSILALTGYLLRRSLSSPLAQRVAIEGVRPVSDERTLRGLRKRCKVAADTTAKKLAAGKRVWGGRVLETILGAAAFAKLRAAVNSLLTIDQPGWSQRARAPAAPSVSENTPESAAPLPERPTIVVSAEIAEMIDQAEVALLAAPEAGIYHRAGELVRVRDGMPETPPSVEALPEDSLMEILSRCAYWVAIKDTPHGPEERHTTPPRSVVKGLRSRNAWRLRGLAGVVEAPSMRLDGSVLSEPGYDDASGVLFVARQSFPPVPSSPTWDDAQRACRDLSEPFAEFPFVAPSHLSACLAAVLSVVGRGAVAGPVPLFAISAPERGTGKSLAADIVSLIATGRDAPKTPPLRDGDEDRKRILSLLLDGSPIVCVDNVEAALGSDVLALLLTSTRFSDRILGASRFVNTPALAVWFATGNNLRVKGDLGRRCVSIRMDAGQEAPEERSDFLRPRPVLMEWCRRERGRLVVAALTVLRAYVLAGRPPVEAKAFGSFENWDHTIRRALMWAGMEDPLGDRDYFREEADPEAQAYRELLSVWRAKFGRDAQTIREACRYAANDGELRDALAALDPRMNPESLDARKVAAVLRKFKGRIADGMVLELAPNRKKAGFSYLVREAHTPLKQPTSTPQAPEQVHDSKDVA